MPFENPPDDAVAQLLRTAKCVAVVGLSDKPERASYAVAVALQRFGYRIVPVNPELREWRGIRAAPDLDHVADALEPGERIDIVDVFRRPEHVSGVVDDCVRLRFPVIWLQRGVIDEAAAERARDAGLMVIMDRCMKIERMRLDEQ